MLCLHCACTCAVLCLSLCLCLCYAGALLHCACACACTVLVLCWCCAGAPLFSPLFLCLCCVLWCATFSSGMNVGHALKGLLACWRQPDNHLGKCPSCSRLIDTFSLKNFFIMHFAKTHHMLWKLMQFTNGLCVHFQLTLLPWPRVWEVYPTFL